MSHLDLAADTDSIGPAIDQVADAIVITDAQGSILYVNAAFTAMTGYTFLEVVGRNPRMLKSGGQDPAYYRDLWKTIQSGSTWQGGLVNRRKDGSTYTEEMTITPVRDSRGKIVRHIAIKRDITERLAGPALEGPEDVLGGVPALLHRGRSDPGDQRPILLDVGQVADDVDVVAAGDAQLGLDQDAPGAVQRHAERPGQRRRGDPRGPDHRVGADPLGTDPDAAGVDPRDLDPGPDGDAQTLELRPRGLG